MEHKILVSVIKYDEYKDGCMIVVIHYNIDLTLLVGFTPRIVHFSCTLQYSFKISKKSIYFQYFFTVVIGREDLQKQQISTLFCG